MGVYQARVPVSVIRAMNCVLIGAYSNTRVEYSHIELQGIPSGTESDSIQLIVEDRNDFV